MSESNRNVYMEQVKREQAQVQADLGRKNRRAMNMPAQQAALPGAFEAQQLMMPPAMAGLGGGGGGGGSESSEPAVDVRITGWWTKRVIVPPNAYVVHTRAGHEQPLHCGLGISFKFAPMTDSFLVVPAAMQTITLSANSICKERQGILVQGYVQWTIGNFALAYKKLDFSDAVDPMRVVNVQLREQAEAAIKDMVATMSIDQVLADKQPIIEELTARLRLLAEGDGKAEGLGLRIITVQIKEAVVSSAKLWESLQRPFRAERQKVARLAELEHEEQVTKREAEVEQARLTAQLQAEEKEAALRAGLEAEAHDREQAERVRRTELEAKSLAARLAHERERMHQESELEKLRIETELAREELRLAHASRNAERELALLQRRIAIENEIGPARLQERLIQHLPALAKELPKPEKHTSISFEGADRLGPLLRELMALAKPATSS